MMMAKINDEQEKKERRIAVGAMLHYIAEGVREGLWTNFTFNVRQHRKERRDTFTGALQDAGPSMLEITFKMDVNESRFKADIAKRTKEVADALRVPNSVAGLLIEHDDKSKVWEIWVEGYLATGMEGVPAKAQKIGKMEAATFKEACIKLCSSKEFQSNWGVFNAKKMTIYGCHLFDNEVDARKSFG